MFWDFIATIFSSPAKRDRIILVNLFLSLLINVSLWAVLLFNFWQMPEYIVTRYNIYFGISALNAWYWILLMPLLGLVIFVINFLLAFNLYLKQKFLSYFLSFGVLAFNFVLLLAGLLLVYENW